MPRKKKPYPSAADAHVRIAAVFTSTVPQSVPGKRKKGRRSEERRPDAVRLCQIPQGSGIFYASPWAMAACAAASLAIGTRKGEQDT